MKFKIFRFNKVNSTNNTATDITNIVAAGAVDREFLGI